MPEQVVRPATAGRTAMTPHGVMPSRTPARVLLGAMTLFIVYGSLFPFNFTATPLPLSRFLAEVDLLANRADAIDNFFLFFPLGIALYASFFRWRARTFGAVLALLSLAIGIQLAQLYLPSRTASLSDAVWNTLGIMSGMLVATQAQAVLAAQVAAHSDKRDNFLLALIALWLCYESFPFVPTLDLGMLRAHARSLVFSPPFEPSRLLQHAGAATLAAVAMMHMGWLRRPQRGLMLLGAMALGLEVCVPYGTLRRETLLGIVLGLAAGHLLACGGPTRNARLVMLLALSMLVFTILTPYRGQGQGSDFTWTPFPHLLLYGSVGRLPPAAFEALAIGAMLWAGQRLARGSALGCCMLTLLVACLFELWRVCVAGYDGDTTLMVLALALAPCAVAWRPRADSVAP
ncbi:VanZ family protein [Massilia yuzhufengensis]|uniref:VanZ like family protein n=1 Tax=Massilia yuzhufengensis TaxID=1164594 RepID=A0A1I1DNE6_9BURK|nr:VanZ family protein [Massilia yuzhufengensis]SFB74578.1 VanZ like family protein [Massilia yuzhufengensis]